MSTHKKAWGGRGFHDASGGPADSLKTPWEKGKGLSPKDKFDSQDWLTKVCHEIRLPVSNIVGTIDMLGEEPLSQRQKEMLEIMRRSAFFMTEIINAFMDMARMENGKLELNRVKFSPKEVLSEAASLLRNQAAGKGLSLKWEAGETVPECVGGDLARYRQILVNLIGNAIKFTNYGSVLVFVDLLRTDKETVWMRTTVSDTGIGIDKDQQDKVFEKFMQVEQGRNMGPISGIGMGLSLVKGLVEGMGGTIELDSEKGRGSSFEVDIPFEVCQKDGLEGDSVEKSKLSKKAFKMLIADDDPINREYTKLMLGDSVEHVRFAENGLEALNMLRHRSFDLVVLDLCMPILNGFETAREIRKRQRPGEKTVILGLTAQKTKEIASRCREAGMDACVQKPLERKALETYLRMESGIR